MSGIARILLDRGGLVSGSDAKESRGVVALRARGASIRIGHDESSLDLLPGGPTAVVTTHAAIPKTNPELVEARRRGIPVILRPVVLAKLMAGHTTLMVTGSVRLTVFRTGSCEPLNENPRQGAGQWVVPLSLPMSRPTKMPRM